MSNQPLPNPHDRFCRAVFGRVPVACDFIVNYAPPAVVALLDLTTLEKSGETFIDAELRESFSDLLFTVKSKGGGEGIVYMLFEHKSYRDALTGYQLLRYIVRIWEQRLRDGLPICCVIPLVIYHGEKPWNVALSLDKLAQAPGELKGYFPRFDAHVVDLSGYSDNELKGNSILQAMLLLLKYASQDDFGERFAEIMRLLRAVIDEPDGLECVKSVITYILNVNTQVTREELNCVTVNALESIGDQIVPTLAEKLREEGRKEGRDEGRDEGVLIGKINLIEEWLGMPETPRDELKHLNLVELEARKTDLSHRLKRQG